MKRRTSYETLVEGTGSVGKSRFKPYPKYKDSGIDWLGEIPEHWEVLRLKAIASLNDEVIAENTDPNTEILYVDISSVENEKGITNKELMSFSEAPSRARRLVRDGDIIVSTVRTYLRAIAAIRNPEPNLVVSTGFAVIRPRDQLKSGFAAYVFNSAYLINEIMARSAGVSYPAINVHELGEIRIAVPPLNEQENITNILYSRIPVIDELISKKQRLIELLKEKRAALINRAVTKGLDPNVPMKDSGIEWLGEIPEHWEVRRMKHIALIQPGKSRVRELGDIEASFIPMENLGESGRIDTSEIRQISDVYEGYTFFEEDDILVAKITPCFENNKGSIARGLKNRVGFGTTELHVIRPLPHIYTDFLAYVTYGMHFRRLGKIEMRGTAGQQRVPEDFIRNFPCALPPYEEQIWIAGFLYEETSRIDKLIDKIYDGIEKLIEYRIALITAAVTGKIDVRGEGA